MLDFLLLNTLQLCLAMAEQSVLIAPAAPEPARQKLRSGERGRAWNVSENMPPSTSAPAMTLGLGLGDSWADTALQAMGGAGQEAASFWTCVGGFMPRPTTSDCPASPSTYRVCVMSRTWSLLADKFSAASLYICANHKDVFAHSATTLRPLLMPGGGCTP